MDYVKGITCTTMAVEGDTVGSGTPPTPGTGSAYTGNDDTAYLNNPKVRMRLTFVPRVSFTSHVIEERWSGWWFCMRSMQLIEASKCPWCMGSTYGEFQHSGSDTSCAPPSAAFRKAA